MAALLPLILPAAMDLLKRFIPDKAEQAQAEIKLREILLEADKVRQETEARKLEAEAKQVESASSVIRAETQGESAAGRNWRPHLMYFFMVLIAYGAVISPLLRAILSVFGIDFPIYTLPSQVWDIVWVCVGGYVMGRSGEKMVGLYTDSKASIAASNASAEIAKFNSERYFQVLRSKVFTHGMSQEQVDAFNEALKEGGIK